MQDSNLTQNVNYYPDQALDILNVSEYMRLFKLQQAEIDRLKTSRLISDEDETMIKNSACQLKKETD